MGAIDHAKVARGLSRGQKSTVRNMNAEFCMLGCSEATAIRLSKRCGLRPALTKIRKSESGISLLALNDDGLAVQKHLAESAA